MVIEKCYLSVYNGFTDKKRSVIKMSKLDKEWKLSQQAQEFFVYTTLGIVPKELFDNNMKAYRDYINKLLKKKDAEKDIINENDFSYKYYCTFMCARAAYNDLCRTLTYKDKYKDKKGNEKGDLKEKESAINNVCFELTNTIYQYYTNGCSNIDLEKLFSVFNNDGKIKEDFVLLSYLEDPEKFYFGQVQKWVNMTLKYLYLLGLVKKEEAKELHIPIDSYILEALWYADREIVIPKSDKKDKYDNEKYCDETFRKHRENKNYADEKVKSWSQWNKNDYDSMRKSLPEGINTNWEHKNWIRIAEKRKGIKFN